MFVAEGSGFQQSPKQGVEGDCVPFFNKPIEERDKLKIENIGNVSDLREVARRRLPRPVFDFIDGAAFAEKTLRANTADFGNHKFRQRVMVDVSSRAITTTIVGQPSAMPVAISPTGLSGMLWGGGAEVLAARAARRAGIPFTLGMMSVCSLEEVSAAAGPVWFQFCMLKDRGLVKLFVERAKAAQAPVLVLTVTWPMSSRNNRLVRAGVTALPPRMSARTLLDFSLRPGWVLRTLLGKPIAFNNFVGHMRGPADIGSIVAQLDNSATWKDVEWLRSLWPHKLIVKGIGDPEDARLAFDSGADAISVSNHGGNQIDDAPSSISLLPLIMDAVGGRGEVLLDGGVRSGQDVLKALALGARACLLGRAHLYGLAAYGEAGVAKMLEIFAKEMDVTMALTGLRDVRDASRAILW